MKKIYASFFKRIFDFFISLVVFVILLPLFLVVMILVRLKLGKPVFFIQKRPGKNEKIFKLIKFRTMKESKNQDGILLDDSQRITKFGAFLRATSLDELPGLINILKGDMSIVGPRPLLVEYLPLYNENQRKRHSIRPGLTGNAQVNGRNAISWEQKFQLDIDYVNNITFLNDIKIMFKTIIKVIKRSDINSNTSVTMEKFRGNKDND